MVTVFRVRRFRIVIYSNDHPPAHVHAIGPECEARIALGRVGEHPRLMTNDGLTRVELEEILTEIGDQIEVLRLRWREIHGDA